MKKSVAYTGAASSSSFKLEDPVNTHAREKTMSSLTLDAPPEAVEMSEADLGGPYHRLILVTPELAAYWLEKNLHNRKVYVGVVREYAAAMRDERWWFDGDSIQFSKEGILLNGQHRLMAQVASGTTLVQSVWYDLDSEVQTVMDTGRKRSFADILELEGEKDSTHLAALTSMLYYYEKGNRGQNLTNFANWNGNRAQHSQLLAFFQEHAEELRGCLPEAKAAHRGTYAPIRVTAFANLLFRRIDKADAEGFMKALASGVGLENESPILLLRQRLVNDYGKKNAVSRPQSWVVLALIIKAWNFWRGGESIKQLVFKSGGVSKELFPEAN